MLVALIVAVSVRLGSLIWSPVCPLHGPVGSMIWTCVPVVPVGPLSVAVHAGAPLVVTVLRLAGGLL